MHDFQRIALKFLAKKLHQTFVFFDRRNTRALRQRKFCQRAKARTDLNDKIFRTDGCLIDKPFREISIV